MRGLCPKPSLLKGHRRVNSAAMDNISRLLKYNKNHKPAGPGGGQFDFADGGGKVAPYDMAVSRSPAKVAAMVTRLARKAGLQVYEDSSGISQSQYLTIGGEKDEGDGGELSVKVRISNHELPPSYGLDAEYDVAADQTNGWPGSVSWASALAGVMQHHGVEIPPRIVATMAAHKQQRDSQWKAFYEKNPSAKPDPRRGLVPGDSSHGDQIWIKREGLEGLSQKAQKKAVKEARAAFDRGFYSPDRQKFLDEWAAKHGQ